MRSKYISINTNKLQLKNTSSELQDLIRFQGIIITQENYMFDEEQQKLLASSLAKVKADLKKNSSVYQVSGFDQTFDTELKNLVILYSFDFDAIATHLYFKYPQYAHRLKPQAVSYRWFQINMERQKANIQKELSEESNTNHNKKQLFECDFMKEEDSNEEEIAFFSLEQKLMQYQTAMLKAQQLDEQQQESFMLYRPKFIIDTEFKLERQASEGGQNLSMLMENQIGFQFGAFEPPQAAPLPQIVQEISQTCPLIEKEVAPAPAQQEDTDYLDSDWQAYESD